MTVIVVSLPGYTSGAGMKDTKLRLQIFQDEDTILLFENRIRGGISSILGDRYVISDDKKVIFFIDANNLCATVLIQSLHFDEINFDKNGKLKDILNTEDDSDLGYILEVDLKCPHTIKNPKIPILFSVLRIKIVLKIIFVLICIKRN